MKQVDLVNKLHETILKHQFMTHAISQLWGDEDALYKEDVIFGCKLLMHDIQTELEEVESLLERRALAVANTQ